MTKFLVKASYTPDGVKGIMKAGGTARKDLVSKMVKDLGGKLESFYFAFGESDVYAIGELPDTTSLAAMSMAINSTGMVAVSITMLIPPEEVDKAAKLTVNYRSPGA